MCASNERYLNGGEVMNNYISNLAPLIDEFIKFKNALGIKYKTSEYYLKQLDLYNYEHQNLSILDRDTVDEYFNFSSPPSQT